jgi:hypothetical protein
MLYWLRIDHFKVLGMFVCLFRLRRLKCLLCVRIYEQQNC